MSEYGNRNSRWSSGSTSPQTAAAAAPARPAWSQGLTRAASLRSRATATVELRRRRRSPRARARSPASTAAPPSTSAMSRGGAVDASDASQRLDRLAAGGADAEHRRPDLRRERERRLDRRVGAEELDPPAVGAQHRRRASAARCRAARRGRRRARRRRARRPAPSDISFPRCARTFAVIACSWATESSPRCQASPVQRRAGVTTSVSACSSGRTANAWSSVADTCRGSLSPNRGDQRIPEIRGIVERGRARLVDHACRLADPPAVTDPVAQPLDALHVGLGVAPLAAGRSLRPEDAVALLPLAQRVRRDARPAREGCDVEEGCWHWTIPGRSLPAPTLGTVRSHRLMPEGDSLHRAAARLHPLVGQRVAAEPRHIRAGS